MHHPPRMLVVLSLLVLACHANPVPDRLQPLSLRLTSNDSLHQLTLRYRAPEQASVTWYNGASIRVYSSNDNTLIRNSFSNGEGTSSLSLSAYSGNIGFLMIDRNLSYLSYDIADFGEDSEIDLPAVEMEMISGDTIVYTPGEDIEMDIRYPVQPDNTDMPMFLWYGIGINGPSPIPAMLSERRFRFRNEQTSRIGDTYESKRVTDFRYFEGIIKASIMYDTARGSSPRIYSSLTKFIPIHQDSHSRPFPQDFFGVTSQSGRVEYFPGLATYLLFYIAGSLPEDVATMELRHVASGTTFAPALRFDTDWLILVSYDVSVLEGDTPGLYRFKVTDNRNRTAETTERVWSFRGSESPPEPSNKPRATLPPNQDIIDFYSQFLVDTESE